ncbi:MAG TPA: SPFH domain-containing protein [Planctomycetaceae bacterium]|nr:SPFH domain-containing protein [Planctomycetaceae bacterium]
MSQDDDLNSIKNRISMAKIALGMIAISIIGFGWVAYEWTVNRIYVPEGYSMQLRYKGPPLPFLPGSKPTAKPGHFAQVDESGNPQELGVLKEMVGPGRHFYSPLWWERTLIEDVIVKPGQVALVSSKMGEQLKGNQYLVDGDLNETEFKGELRKVFGPGRYRINSYAYTHRIVEEELIKSGNQIKHAGWVEIPAGFVGVVTNLTDNPITKAESGLQDKVLPPGIYPVNPREQQIDIVEIGFRESTINANLAKGPDGRVILDKSGEPMIATDGSGISFPSNDGFTIQMDFTAIWGIMPDQAADVIGKFGNVQAVETKVVIPQIESICRNQGSTLGAVELLVGESRQKFQEETSRAFQKVLEDKDVTLLYGLVRHIYIPQEVRIPIQESFIADEKKLTREQDQLTTRTEATLRQEKEKVNLEGERIIVETEKVLAKALAEGDKEAAETEAETQKLVAAIDRQIAELEAEAKIVLGTAEAEAQQLSEEAKAQKFALAVEAFGSGEAFNEWVFASGLPDDIELNTLYAGEGTFWTDLKGFTETLLGKQVQGQTPRPAPSR